ncbi:hypothetical protein K438DRAFT_1748407 [Mycena galopus ATCC 62051]|nr:hypothetical protein K438DRAFT_1748407 [Mycena galopus ATCC 62051]
MRVNACTAFGATLRVRMRTCIPSVPPFSSRGSASPEQKIARRAASRLCYAGQWWPRNVKAVSGALVCAVRVRGEKALGYAALRDAPSWGEAKQNLGNLRATREVDATSVAVLVIVAERKWRAEGEVRGSATEQSQGAAPIQVLCELEDRLRVESYTLFADDGGEHVVVIEGEGRDTQPEKNRCVHLAPWF